MQLGGGFTHPKGGTSPAPRPEELLAVGRGSCARQGAKTLETSVMFRILAPRGRILSLILSILGHLLPILAEVSSSWPNLAGLGNL